MEERDIKEKLKLELGFDCYCKENERLGIRKCNPCGFCRTLKKEIKRINKV